MNSLIIECPYCQSHQYQEWIYEMDVDEEEEGDCDTCGESLLIYRSDETTFDVYKLR